MQEILFDYRLNPTTWAYISALMMIGIYFKFRRFWSVRNLDLVALIGFSPALLLVYYGLVKQSDELIRLHPDYYSFYWPKAEALCRLGREAEAIAPLSKYVEYCKNELPFPEAVALLKRIKETPADK